MRGIRIDLHRGPQDGAPGGGGEIDPLYCDKIIRRWQTYAKDDAVLLATGETFERITVHTGKGTNRLAKMEALVQRVTNGALLGEASATRLLMAMIQMAGLQSDLGDALDAAQTARVAQEDQAILSRMFGTSVHAGSVPIAIDGLTDTGESARSRNEAVGGRDAAAPHAASTKSPLASATPMAGISTRSLGI